MDWDVLVLNETNENLEIYEDLISRAFLNAVKAAQIRQGEVSVLLVDDNQMRQINKTHRGKDSTTDVLAFPQYSALELAERKPDDFVLLGDIIISIEKAASQAAEYGHSLERELAFLTIHATLHLLGHDHDNPESERAMFALQNEILIKTLETRN
jgi:probable rRNA maturation factor